MGEGWNDNWQNVKSQKSSEHWKGNQNAENWKDQNTKVQSELKKSERWKEHQKLVKSEHQVFPTKETFDEMMILKTG
jgi:hypothetical protein